MPDQPSHAKQAQIERARRLRRQIERLKRGAVADDEDADTGQSKSLKEQVEDRAAEQARPTDSD